MYSKDAFEETEKILNRFTINEIKELRYQVARFAIHSKIGKTPILKTCRELADISFKSLLQEGLDEEKFLEPLIEMLKKGKCPCEG
jgi:gamma-glutamylcysteine synthetase